MARGDRSRQDDNGYDGGNHVRLGPRDSLYGKLTIAGDLPVQGTVEASLEGRNVTVQGQVQGNVTARRRLTLSGSGALNGDVRVSRLSVEDGAMINGNIDMQPAGPEEFAENGEAPAEGETVAVAETEQQG